MRFSPTKFIPGLLLLTSLLLAACGGGGGSSGGGVVATPPAAPTGVSAIDATGCNLRIQVSWSASTGATSYNIYRSDTIGVTATIGNKINTTTVTASPYIDTTVSPSLSYYYIVTAVSSAGESTVSAEATASTPAALTCSQLGGSLQDIALSLTKDVTTKAGTTGTAGFANDTGTAATFRTPAGITTDGVDIYVADTLNHAIRKIAISSGAVTTIAGTGDAGNFDDPIGTNAQFNSPEGITTDGTNLYVADTQNHIIRQIVIATGAVTTLAGNGTSGNTDANSTSAQFSSPRGITTDGTDIYVSDTANHIIRKVTIGGLQTVTTIAGTVIAGIGTSGSNDHATGTSAGFNSPQGITMDTTNLYVADTGNNAIREITIGGTQTVTTRQSGLSFPQGITSDGTNLYITNTNDHTIHQMAIGVWTPSAVVGTSATSGSTNGNGTSALFYLPAGITTDGAYLYAVDAGNNTIRKIQ